jgi:hypothetical protein
MLNLKLNDIGTIIGSEQLQPNLLTGKKVTLNLINAFASNKQVLTVKRIYTLNATGYFGYDAQVKAVTVNNSTLRTCRPAGAAPDLLFPQSVSSHLPEVIASITEHRHSENYRDICSVPIQECGIF